MDLEVTFILGVHVCTLIIFGSIIFTDIWSMKITNSQYSSGPMTITNSQDNAGAIVLTKSRNDIGVEAFKVKTPVSCG